MSPTVGHPWEKREPRAFYNQGHFCSLSSLSKKQWFAGQAHSTGNHFCGWFYAVPVVPSHPLYLPKQSTLVASQRPTVYASFHTHSHHSFPEGRGMFHQQYFRAWIGLSFVPIMFHIVFFVFTLLLVLLFWLCICKSLLCFLHVFHIYGINVV